MLKKLSALCALLIPLAANAAISFVDGTTATNAAASSVTPAEPSGAAQNDLIIAFCTAQQTSGVTWTDPADFTEIDQVQSSAGSPTVKTYVGYKVRGATSGSGYTFSHADTANDIACSLVAYRGVSTATPFDVTYFKANHYLQGAVNDPNMTAQPITTVSANSWVILLYTTTQGISGAAGAPSGYTVDEDNLSSTAGQHRVTFITHKLVASASTETPGAYTHTDDGAGADPDPQTYTLALRLGSTVPVFSAGPAQVAVTTTSVQLSFTSDTTGTVRGVFCANGAGTPSVAEVIAGQCAGGTTAIASYSEAVTAGVADGNTISGLPPSTTFNTFHVIDAASDSNVASLADQTTTTLAFTSTPTRSAAIANGHRLSYVINGAATVYFTWCNPGDVAPSNAENELGQCGGGNSAIVAGNEVAVSGASETFDLTAANKPVRATLYVSAKLSGISTSVTTLANYDRSPDAGQAIIFPSSLSATSIFTTNSAHWSPTFAVGDGGEYDTATNEAANCYVLFEADGDFALYDHTDGVLNVFTAGDNLDSTDAGTDSVDDCAGRRSFDTSWQDGSNATNGCFVSPSGACFSADERIYNGNTPPEFVGNDTDMVLIRNSAMTSLDVASEHWTDDDGDAITVTYQDTLPTGLTLNTNVLSGTPTVCGISIETERATDITGEYTEQDIEIGVGDIIPDVTGMDATEAAAILEALCQ